MSASRPIRGSCSGPTPRSRAATTLSLRLRALAGSGTVGCVSILLIGRRGEKRFIDRTPGRMNERALRAKVGTNRAAGRCQALDMISRTYLAQGTRKRRAPVVAAILAA